MGVANNYSLQQTKESTNLEHTNNNALVDSWFNGNKRDVAIGLSKLPRSESVRFSTAIAMHPSWTLGDYRQLIELLDEEEQD